MLLQVNNLTKSYGATTVLHNVSFVLNDSDRVGVVGTNGVGKSTLLKILVGQESKDAGTYSYAPSLEVGYVAQTTPDFYGYTIEDLILESVGSLRQLEDRMRQLEAAMAEASDEQLDLLLAEYGDVSTEFTERGGYELDHKIDQIMSGLRISYLPRARHVDTLSGGEKARVYLATLLLRSPQLLLLDEPTNHLDFGSLEWLETYLAELKGSVLVVSHDRRFLNLTVNSIFEIDEYTHELKKYSGNYDAYVLIKANERAKWQDDYQRQQDEIKELRSFVRGTARYVGYNRPARDADKTAHNFRGERVQRTVARNVRAAEEKLQRIEEDPIPKPPAPMRINPRFNSDTLNADVAISLENVSKYYEDKCVLRELNFTMDSRSRILLVGPNGAGKTTLLRIIKGLNLPDSGNVKLATDSRVGYLPQESFLPDLTGTVLDTYRHGLIGYEEEFVADLLRYGLFRLEDLSKTVGQLSLGQRRKLEIARLIADDPQMLLLDEPTNYISLDVLSAFEEAVAEFCGPIIAVSHDRWFIERFKGEVWELMEGNLIKHTTRYDLQPGTAE